MALLLRPNFIACVLGTVLMLATASANASTVEYTYDANGRLTGVYAPSGDAAIYVYDPAGNITSIQRFSASDLNVTDFTPTSGPVSTQVTVYGTGFDATPANDVVTFNGTAATVSSATSNKLVVTVPAGATTGPIGVTVATRSAQSGTNFTVTSGSSSAPTITSFTPTVGAVGTPVTISGTNFNTSPALDNVSFNTAFTPASSATSTSISATVPATAASGPIKVRTPNGTATSSTDFLATFGTIATTAIIGSARAVVDGATASFSIPSNGKVFYVLFDGTQTQNIGIAVTVSGCTFVYVQRPDNVQLVNQEFCSSGTIDLPNLPLTGTYTVALQSAIGAVDSGVITVSTDGTGTLGSEGNISTFSTSRAGQNGRYTFTATAGQMAAIYVYGLPAAVQPSRIDLLLPNQQVLASILSQGTSGYIQTQTLSASGTYTVVISPQGVGTGSWSVQYGQPDLTVTNFSVGTISVAQSGAYQIPMTATVKNQGTVGAKRAWNDELYLSSDATLDTSDPKIASSSSGSDVAAGGTYAVNLTSSTATTVTPGSYTVFFKTDGYDASGKYADTPTGLTESDETNNVVSSAVTLPGYPDLVASNLSLGAITVNQDGSYSFSATFTVTNNGASTAKASWYDECYLSSDATLDTTDLYIGRRSQSTDVAPGAQYPASITCRTATTTAPGAYTVFAKTDGYDASGKYSTFSTVAEADEANNAQSASITLPGRPDLVASNLSVGTITTNADGSYSIPVTFTVTNNGGSTAKASWYDECYLSADGTLDTTDLYLGKHQQTTDLASGGSYPVSLTCRTATTTTAGSYSLFVKTDGYDVSGKYSAMSWVSEADETNNAASQAITLPTK